MPQDIIIFANMGKNSHIDATYNVSVNAKEFYIPSLNLNNIAPTVNKITKRHINNER